MIVTQLTLTDFRNYRSAELDIARGANVFVGSNGQGKTNLVEALAFIGTLASHRVSSHQALIRQGQDAAVIRAKLEHGERQILVELQLNRAAPNRAQINRTPIKTAEVTRYFSCVMFAPEDLTLVRGDPAGRRRYIDDVLCQLTPRLRGVMADYERVLRQRNTLLKAARARKTGVAELATLDVWDERLVGLGTMIIQARSALVSQLAPLVNNAYVEIAGPTHRVALEESWSITNPEDASLGLPSALSTEGGSLSAAVPRSEDEISEIFRAALTRVRRQELDRGVSLVGPHRDDVILELNGLGARGHASHGESWSLALALKLASARLLRIDSPIGDPVIILDDVFAELDKSRRARLSAAISDYEQVLITAAVLEDVPPELAGHIIHIEAGTIIDGAAPQ
jgi:DNA replication and repair protein RecF